MTQWIEVTVEVDGEGAEAVAEALRRYVHQGIVIEQKFPGEAWEDEPRPPASLVVKAYFADTDEAPETREKIEQALSYLRMLYSAIPEPTFSHVKDVDWAEAWKKHYHPVRVGEHILIKPAWLEAESKPEDIVLELDPGMAFGTGTHPTTQLCLMACEWFCRPAMNMLDVGTGSGILAIAGAKLGCHEVLGLEIDELAVQVAKENVDRNGVSEQVKIVHGTTSSLAHTNRHFELAFANLTAKIIHSLIPDGLQHVVWPHGKFIFSGIIDDQADEVIAALEAIDLKLLDQRQMGDWVMLITQRQPPA